MATPQPTKFNILLLGDSCVDHYVLGTIERLSPEAPVPILCPKDRLAKPGMAANVAQNLRALGCDVVSVFGLESTKTRFIDTKTNQHLLRIDEDCTAQQPLQIEDLADNFSQYDAIAISDYDKGYITAELIERVIEKFDGPVFLDTKKTDLARFNCFVKINAQEYINRTSEPLSAVITLGEQGAVWDGVHYSTVKVQNGDVCGAGDTFFAALVYSYLLTSDMCEAVKFANKTSSITVEHLGTYAPSLEEINER